MLVMVLCMAGIASATVLTAKGLNRLVYPAEVVTATASSQYTSSTTALDTITRTGMSVYGGNDVHNTVYQDMWLSTNGGLGSQPWIKWQFDQAYSIDTMFVWNYNQAGYTARGMRHTKIEYSLNGTDWTTLYADYELARAPGTS